MKKNLLCLVSNIRAVALCLAVVCSTIASWATPAVDDTFIEGDLTYTVTSVSPYECSVGKVNEKITEAQISETVSYEGVNFKVTSLSEFAFSSCGSLSSITIPSSVTSIGNYAFYRCTSLSSIEIPESVTSIKESAFNSCGSLSSITIPSRVTSIGGYAFMGCPLTQVTCKGTTPPECENNTFLGVTLANCKLIVPKSSVDAYKSATIWERFGTISTLVKKINIEYNDGTATLSIDRLNVKKLTFTED